jgi:hypothetical protein
MYNQGAEGGRGWTGSASAMPPRHGHRRGHDRVALHVQAIGGCPKQPQLPRRALRPQGTQLLGDAISTPLPHMKFHGLMA